MNYYLDSAAPKTGTDFPQTNFFCITKVLGEEGKKEEDKSPGRMVWHGMRDYPEGRNSASPNKGSLLPASQKTSLQLTQIQGRRSASTAPHPAQLAALGTGGAARKSCDRTCVWHPQQSEGRRSCAGCCHWDCIPAGMKGEHAVRWVSSQCKNSTNSSDHAIYSFFSSRIQTNPECIQRNCRLAMTPLWRVNM